MKTVWKIISTVIKVVFFVVPLVLIFYVLGAKIKGNTPYLFGYGTSIVTTGSMEDVLPVGTIILTREYDGAPIEVGTIITYEGRSGSYQGKLVTHEVIAVNKDSGGNVTSYTTKGTMNNVEDPAVTTDMVEAIFVCKIISLGKVFTLMQKPGGVLTVLVIPIILVIGYESWELFRMMKKEPKTNDEKTDEEKHA